MSYASFKKEKSKKTGSKNSSKKGKTVKESKEKLKNKAEGKKGRSKKEKTLKIKTKGKSTAKKVAKKTLKENMKQEYQITLNVDGNTKYLAGAIIELDESWGKFEGKYVIDKVTHNVTGDYACEINAMKLGARENAEQNAIAQTKEEQRQKEAEKQAKSKGRKGRSGKSSSKKKGRKARNKKK